MGRSLNKFTSNPDVTPELKASISKKYYNQKNILLQSKKISDRGRKEEGRKEEGNERPCSDPFCRICQQSCVSSTVMSVTVPTSVPVNPNLGTERTPPVTTALDSDCTSGSAEGSSQPQDRGSLHGSSSPVVAVPVHPVFVTEQMPPLTAALESERNAGVDV
jgi:hypothetical protein